VNGNLPAIKRITFLFNRIDTKLAKESRAERWDFLARHLK
jgi:hypothetical protein